jgi:hypothetical protein
MIGLIGLIYLYILLLLKNNIRIDIRRYKKFEGFFWSNSWYKVDKELNKFDAELCRTDYNIKFKSEPCYLLFILKWS